MAQTQQVPTKTAATAETMDIGLTQEGRTAVARMLNELLADEFVLYTKTRNHHWNVTGPHFAQLHALFEQQYTQLNGFVDDVAERIRQLGAWSPGSLTEFLAATHLRESPGDAVAARDRVADLLNDHEILIQQLRKDADACADEYHDLGTQDFLIGVMEAHEKTAWILRATLNGWTA